MSEAHATCWDQMEDLRWRFALEYGFVRAICTALKWQLSDPRKLHGIRWRAHCGPKRLDNVLRSESAMGLLRQVERAEVARRAQRIEREVTREQLDAAGFKLKDPRCGTWWAVHRVSKHVLAAPSAAELRQQLREYTRNAETLEVADG